jgi:hypothetical protein
MHNGWRDVLHICNLMYRVSDNSLIQSYYILQLQQSYTSMVPYNNFEERDPSSYSVPLHNSDTTFAVQIINYLIL